MCCVRLPELELVVQLDVLEPRDQLDRSSDLARCSFIEMRRSSVLTRYGMAARSGSLLCRCC